MPEFTCIGSVGVKRRTIFFAARKFRHNVGKAKKIGYWDSELEAHSSDRKYTDRGRPVRSVVSTMACLCVKRLKRIHPCFYSFLNNLLKPFFSRQKPFKNLFFQDKNLLEKPFFLVSVAGKPGTVTLQMIYAKK